MRSVAWGLMLMLQVTTAAAQSVTGVEITKVGTYAGDVKGTTPAPGTPSGYTTQVAYRFVEAGTDVTLCKGVRFGFEYRLLGSPAGAAVALRKVTIFPAPGLSNPARPGIVGRSEHTDMPTIGNLDLKGYSLDETWEVVPGRWVQQVWLGSRMLA